MSQPQMEPAAMADDVTVTTEAQLLAQAPLPHERVLYWGSGSPQAWRVLIMLEEKGLPYRSVCVSFSSGVLKSPFFRALNPRMRVPLLVEPLAASSEDNSSNSTSTSTSGELSTPAAHEASPTATACRTTCSAREKAALLAPSRTIVYESPAILEYLERRYPVPACMPATLPCFALAQTRMHEANEILSVVGDLVVYLRRFPPAQRNPAIVAAKWNLVETELNLWEAYLDGHAFLTSLETPYLCDFTLFTNVAYAVRCGLQLDGLFPRLAMFYVRMCARASVDKSWPPHWRTTLGSKVLTKCFYCAGKALCSCTCSAAPGTTAMTSHSPANGHGHGSAEDTVDEAATAMAQASMASEEKKKNGSEMVSNAELLPPEKSERVCENVS